MTCHAGYLITLLRNAHNISLLWRHDDYDVIVWYSLPICSVNSPRRCVDQSRFPVLVLIQQKRLWSHPQGQNLTRCTATVDREQMTGISDFPVPERCHDWEVIRNAICRKQPNPLQWRHNERDGVSNHRCLDCLLNCLYVIMWFGTVGKNPSPTHSANVYFSEYLLSYCDGNLQG